MLVNTNRPNGQEIEVMESVTEVCNEASGHPLFIDVDGQKFSLHDPVLTGHQILEIADKRPPDDFIVYWLGKDNILKDLGLEATVHLHRDGVERFLTFRNDRSFRFEIDGKREDWGAAMITEETLRMLAGVECNCRIWLELKDEPDRLIARGESVDLTAPGIERFYCERALVVTIVNEDNGVDFELEGFGDTRIEWFIEKMYEKLCVPRRADDRLRCEDGGADVIAFAKLTLKEYLDAGNCRCLVWLFAGGTGGATCR